MVSINVIHTNTDAAKRFVDVCENEFKRRIEKVATDIISNKSIKIVTLTGPTCSGKTTTACLLTAFFEKNGRKARVLSVDDFYYDSEYMQKNNITDFEGINAIDLELFRDVATNLAKGNTTFIPTFDFKERRRVALTEYTPSENDIYIIEGIQAMYPEITAILGKIGVKSIFINVDNAVEVGGNVFDKFELRLMRRTVRDYFHRASSPELTMVLWKNVRRNEDANIFPYAVRADYTINSLLPYEIFIIGKYYLEVTENYSAVAADYSTVENLRARLEKISNNCITVNMIPDDSVFREFIV